MNRFLVRTAYPLGKFITDRIGGRRIAKKLYDTLTPKSSRWVRIHNSLLLTNIHDNGIGTLLFLKGSYANGRVSIIRELVKSGNTVVDIGANIGYFTTLMVNLVGKKGNVYAFEPDLRSVNLLCQTVEKNRWNNVIVNQKAISNKSGICQFYQTESWTANTLSKDIHKSIVTVPVTTLDEYFPTISVDFIKMDMDGSELLAIESMVNLISRSPNIKILVEYHPTNLKRYMDNPLKFIDIANQCGLELFGILDSDNGLLPDLNLDRLSRIEGDDNLDLLFKRK
jgi:FkbM family methyltransferase